MLGRLLFIVGCIVVGEVPAPLQMIAHAPRTAVMALGTPTRARTAEGNVRAPLFASVAIRAPLYRTELRTAPREAPGFCSGFVQPGRASRPESTITR